jgi:flavin-dependent dehydrogenase
VRPAFALDDIAVGAHELDAGYATRCSRRRALERAVELGAETRYGAAVNAIEPDGLGGRRDGDSSRFSCSRVLVAAGRDRPLAAQVGADLPLTVERHIVATFAWGG